METNDPQVAGDERQDTSTKEAAREGDFVAHDESFGGLEGKDLIVEIDEQIAVLIEEINAAPSESKVDFAENLKNVVVDSILGPFGLSASMFADKRGGNITTAHNFEEALKPGNEDIIAHRDAERLQSLRDARNNRIDRSVGNKKEGILPGKDRIYDDRLDTVMPLPSEKPLPAGTKDAYTGKEMITPSRDHVVPVSEIERSVKGHLAQTKEERVATASMKENLVWTEKTLNSSKSNNDLLEWGTQESGKLGPTYAQQAGVDWDRAKPIYDEAHKAIDRAQNIALLKKQSREFMIEGGSEAGKLAFRQIIGMIMKDLASGLIDDIKKIISEGFQSLAQLAKILRDRLSTTAEAIKQKWADYLAEGASAGLAGLLSSLITLLINSFITTAKRVVTIIREGTLAVVKSVKLIVSPPEGMTGAEIASEVLKLLSGSLVTAATLTLIEAVAKVLESSILSPFAQEIASVSVGILSGTLGLLTVLAFDKLKDHIAFQCKALADLHRGQAVSILRVKQTVVVLDRGYSHIESSNDRMHLQIEESKARQVEGSRQVDEAIEGMSRAVQKFRDLGRG